MQPSHPGGVLSVHCPYRRLLLQLLELSDGVLSLLELCAGLLALLFHCGQLPLDQVILLSLLGSSDLTLTQPIRDKRRGEPSKERWVGIKLHGGNIGVEFWSMNMLLTSSVQVIYSEVILCNYLFKICKKTCGHVFAK